jgi:predicted Zn-dependent peptidase
VYRLADEYLSNYVKNIEAVTAADVQRVAKQYIQPSRFIVMIVGDRKAIEPGVKAMNLGPMTVMTVDEVFGKQ